MFKTKCKLLVVLFIALVFFNPVKTLAMFGGSDGSDDAAQTQGKKPAAPEKSTDPAAEDSPPPPPEEPPLPPPPEAVFAASAEGSSDMVPPPPPVDYNHQLEALLDDPAKQARIEVRVIQRLQAIDQSGAFSGTFVNVLNECDRIRTLKRGITVNGKPVDLRDSDVQGPKYQGFLATQFITIPWEALKRLYDTDPNIQKLSLDIIRMLSDMVNENPENKVFFERVIQVLYHSRRLLATTICPQIIKTYGVADAQGIRYRTIKQPITEGPNAGGERNTQVCEFTSEGKNYACLLRKKTSGTHFGAFVDIGEVKRQAPNDIPVLRKKTCKRFFLKAYHGYPALENKDSGDTKLDTEELRTSVSSDPHAKPAAPLDLSEPFVYKLLEHLDLGPKVHFMINPYINNGFYIVTEDLNSAENQFFELDQISDVGLLLEDEKNHSKIVNDLTLASMLVNILDLGDIKGDNLGYIDNSRQIEEYNLERAKLIIIDFLTPPTKLLAPQSEKILDLTSCVNSFLRGYVFISDEGVEIYKPLLESVAKDLQVINDFFSTKNRLTSEPPQETGRKTRGSKKLSKPRLIVPPDQKIAMLKKSLTTKIKTISSKTLPALDESVSIKIAQGQDAMNKFEIRFSGQPFESIVQATEEEIIGLLYSPANFDDSIFAGRSNFVALGLQEASFRLQLRSYCTFICQNFNELKGFLTEGHRAWLANLHQQIDVALEETRTMGLPAPPK
ncbi:MAG: hypothetical protein LBI41_05595 [Lactobacillales bacterium]|jgi:hypothetical protein|nr:hypothetical protein [Lactobacillales bacterium]